MKKWRFLGLGNKTFFFMNASELVINLKNIYFNFPSQNTSQWKTSGMKNYIENNIRQSREKTDGKVLETYL